MTDVTISGYWTDLAGTALSGTITASPTISPLWIKFGSNWTEVKNGTRTATVSAGAWSISVPHAVDCYPTTVLWQLTMPDGSVWAGPPPAASATLYDLLTTGGSGWGPVQGQAAPPIQVVQGPTGPAGSGVLPTGVVDIADYASLAAAVTALGSTPTTIAISGSINITVDTTVPRNIALWMEAGGRFVVYSGKTLTIDGPLETPPVRQIFTGGGAVRLGPQIPEQWVDWYGAVADADGTSSHGTDSTAAIQQAFDSMPTGGGVTIRATAGAYRITSTLNIICDPGHRRQASFTFQGESGHESMGPVITGTQLVWDGNNSTPMVKLHSQFVTFANCCFTVVSGGTLTAAFAVDPEPGSPDICTANRWRDCAFLSGTALYTGTMTDGIVIGASGAANCEYMTFDDCLFDRLGHAGVWIDNGTYQSKSHVCRRCSFSGMPYGWYAASGSAAFFSCNYASLSVCAMYMGAASDAITIIDGESEGCLQLLSAPSGGGELITIVGGRFATDGITGAPADETACFIYATAPVVMVGISFDGTSGSQYLWIAAPTLDVSACNFNKPPPTRNALWYLQPAPDWHTFPPEVAAHHIRVFACPGVLDGSYVKDYGQGPDITIDKRQRYPGRSNVNIQRIRGAQDIDVDVLNLVAYRNWPVPALSSASVVTDISTGSLSLTPGYYYDVTYITDAGETKAHEYALLYYPTTRSGSGRIIWSDVPIGPPGVTGRRMYRSTDESTWYASTLANNTGTTITDDGTWASSAAPPGTDTSGIVGCKTGPFDMSAVTTATAGAASGYLVIDVDGTLKKIPLYAVS